MKRFLLFGGGNYYAAGTFSDFIDSFDSRDEAKKAGSIMRGDLNSSLEWYQVFDCEKRVLIEAVGYPYSGDNNSDLLEKFGGDNVNPAKPVGPENEKERS